MNPLDPSYPPELEAELAAEAEAYRELTNELGVAVRAAQGEAYEQWCEWEEAVDGQATDTSGDAPLEKAPSPQRRPSTRSVGSVGSRAPSHGRQSRTRRILRRMRAHPLLVLGALVLSIGAAAQTLPGRSFLWNIGVGEPNVFTYRIAIPRSGPAEFRYEIPPWTDVVTYEYVSPLFEGVDPRVAKARVVRVEGSGSEQPIPARIEWTLEPEPVVSITIDNDILASGTYRFYFKPSASDDEFSFETTVQFPWWIYIVPETAKPPSSRVLEATPEPAGRASPAAASKPAGGAVGTQRSCFADCNGDGRIRSNEIILIQRIARGDLDLSACPAGDRNGDGLVGEDDLEALQRVGLACGDPEEEPLPAE